MTHLTPPVVVQWTDIPNGRRCTLTFGHNETQLDVINGKVHVDGAAFDWHSSDTFFTLLIAAFKTAGCDDHGVRLLRDAALQALGDPPQEWTKTWHERTGDKQRIDPGTFRKWMRSRPTELTMLALDFPMRCLVKTKDMPDGIGYAIPRHGTVGFVDDWFGPSPEWPRGGLVVKPCPQSTQLIGLCDPDRMEVVGYYYGLSANEFAEILAQGKA